MKSIDFKLNEELVGRIRELSDVIVMWGGGKDSTAMLLLASLYAKQGIFNKLTIVTFDNFLATKSVHENRKKIVSYLKKNDINFEWIVNDFGGEAKVRELYKQALLKTGAPRAVCMLCNIMAEVSENRALNEKKARYRISGNPSDEFETFKQWEKNLGFRKVSKNPRYNTIYGWSRVFDEWLDYLIEDVDIDKNTIRNFRLPKPRITDYSVRAENLALFDFHREFISPEYRLAFVERFGWKLPPVKEGVIGTETDCMFPSIMYGLHLLRDEDYVSKLRELEREDMMPKDVLYRGINNIEDVLKKARQFLNSLGISEDEWRKSFGEELKMPDSLRKYIRNCLLPVR